MPTGHPDIWLSDDDRLLQIRLGVFFLRLWDHKDRVERDATKKYDTFPLGQFAILCSLRLLDPLTFTQIFPYINQLVTELDIVNDPAQGLIESIFAVTGLFAVLFWGILADEIGRRPVILFGCAGMALATLLFGLINYLYYNSVPPSVGLFAGNGSVLPTAVGDITTPGNKDIYFPLFACFWPLGHDYWGSFQNPATKFALFKDSIFFQALRLIWCIAFAFLSELKYVIPVADYGTLRPATSKRMLSTEKDSSGGASNSMLQALCRSGLCAGFLAVAFEVVFTLFCYTPIELGGLSFSPEKIAFTLSVSGVASTILQAFVMPILLRWYGPERVYWVCTCAWPFPFIIIPVLNAIARWELDGGPALLTQILLWSCISLILCIVRVGTAALLYNTRILSDYLPSEKLATGNGLLQVCVCVSRIFGPAVASALFVASKQYNLANGHLWAIVLALGGVGAAITGREVDTRAAHKIQ
ncbi:major facilitator superfamily domain-containing protein [Flagelloscypha sp. PMI_526]|nr:major facilitator superfamily domain-containing protein [Flagelloscypha sp. PMI_526]